VNYFLGILDPGLAGIKPSNFAKINTNPLTVAGIVWGLKMAFQSNGTGMVVYTDNANVKRRKIYAKGKLSGAAVAAFHPPLNGKQLLYPNVVLANGATGLRGLVIAVQGPFSSGGLAITWAQPIDGNGLPLGSPIKIDTTASTNTALGTALLALP